VNVTFEIEKRDFVRVQVSVPIHYKFMSHAHSGPVLEQVHEGSTSNLSSGGLLLRGMVPDLSWLGPLLTGSMAVGVNLILPGFGVPVKALTRVVWIERLEEVTQKAYLGLRFQEITQTAREEILQYIIKTQMP
jgi:c-di-GMP-binding flagellar brake protein YcgR